MIETTTILLDRSNQPARGIIQHKAGDARGCDFELCGCYDHGDFIAWGRRN